MIFGDQNMSEPVAVEIGPRDIPLIKELKSDLLPSQPGKVIYIEKEKSWLGNLKGNIKKDDTIVQGDASKLALAPQSADLVFLKDVIGHQGQPEYVKSGLTGRLAKTGGIANIASELSRVTKEGGKVVILETATPYDKDEIIAKFTQGNFTISQNLDKDQIHEIFEDPVLGKAIAKASDIRTYALVFEKS